MQLRALTGDGWIERASLHQRALLVKPLTYMNASGEAVGPLARYYQIDLDQIIVIHDDLDLEAGMLRLRKNGGSGGHNGVQSLIEHLGGKDFHRARVGIGRPPGSMDPAAYVLQDFSANEEELFGALRDKICAAVESWLFEGIETAMNKFNS
jgi:PTH1 family peptidyl-tRNA hydrolase